jgi:hypothetical protein
VQVQVGGEEGQGANLESANGRRQISKSAIGKTGNVKTCNLIGKSDERRTKAAVQCLE